jgi:hypothetical protein
LIKRRMKMRRTLSKEGRDRKHKRILGKQQSDKRTSMNSRTRNTRQPSSSAKGGGGLQKDTLPMSRILVYQAWVWMMEIRGKGSLTIRQVQSKPVRMAV